MSTLATIGTPRLAGPSGARTAAVSWRFIALAAVGAFALITVLNVSFRVFHDVYATVRTSTAHLITPTLIVGGVFFAATLIGLISTGKLQPRDLGWQRSKVVPGLAGVVGVWIAMQSVEVAAALASGAPLQLSADWTAAAWATTVGVLLGQFLALAPGEETFFRGFLLPQLRMRFAGMRATGAVAAAIVVSQLLFALYHLPNLVMGNSGKVGTGATDIAVQLGWDLLFGVVFAGLYLRTGNLFLVIGIHALQNAGTSLVAAPIDPSVVIVVLAVLLLLATFVPVHRHGALHRAYEPASGELTAHLDR